jgi:hypothetical protein
MSPPPRTHARTHTHTHIWRLVFAMNKTTNTRDPIICQWTIQLAGYTCMIFCFLVLHIIAHFHKCEYVWTRLPSLSFLLTVSARAEVRDGKRRAGLMARVEMRGQDVPSTWPYTPASNVTTSCKTWVSLPNIRCICKCTLAVNNNKNNKNFLAIVTQQDALHEDNKQTWYAGNN